MGHGSSSVSGKDSRAELVSLAMLSNTWEESLSEGLSALDWPMGTSVGHCLKLTSVGRPSSLWAALFPREEV